jgi:Fe-S-cluster containining protein
MKITKDTTTEEALKIGSDCQRCGRCCTYGSGFMLESEVARIAQFLKLPKDRFVKDFLLETEIFHTPVFKIRSLKKKDAPYGPCMFLEKNMCGIHDVKPLHCRVCNCKDGDDLHAWFMVHYCLNIYDPESVRQYDSYVKTGGRMIPGAELEKLFPDKQMLRKILSYERFK